LPRHKPHERPVLNHRHPLSRGLNLAWLLTERGGTSVWDSSTRKSAASLAGTFTPGWATDFDGPCVTLSGRDYERITGTDDVPFKTLDVSVAMWLYWSAHDSWALLAGKTNGSIVTTNHDWSVLFNGTNNTIYLIRNGANTTAVAGPAQNAWVHMVATFGASQSKVYYNGALSSTGSGFGAGVTANTASRLVSVYGYASNSVDVVGRVSSVLVWDRYLSQHDVGELYADTYAMFRTPRLVAKPPAVAAGNNLAWKLAAARPSLAGVGGLAG